MTIAFDAYSNSGLALAVDFDWTHTPVGTPRGAVVHVMQNNNGGSALTTTYNAISMTLVESREMDAAADQTGYVFFLGTGLPSGAVTVAVDRQSDRHHATCITYTAADDTEVVDHGFYDSVTDGALTSPSIALDHAGRDCAVSLAHTGPNNSITLRSGYTSLLSSAGYSEGTSTANVAVYNTIGSTNVNAGFDTTFAMGSDILWAIAVAELVGGGGPTDYFQDVGGVLSLTGGLGRAVGKNIAGDLTYSGLASKDTTRTLSGAVTFVGVETPSVGLSQDLSGSVSFSGGVTKAISKLVSGAVDFAGEISRATAKQLSGTLSLLGGLIPSIAFEQVVSGAISFAKLLGTLLVPFVPGGVIQVWRAVWQRVWREPIEGDDE